MEKKHLLRQKSIDSKAVWLFYNGTSYAALDYDK